MSMVKTEIARPAGLMRESWALIGVSATDLLVTLRLLGNPGVREGNPLMGYYLDVGLWAFIGVKLLLIALPVFLAEYSKRFKPEFTRSMMRLAIVAYVGLYLVLFATSNLTPPSVAKIVIRSPIGRRADALICKDSHLLQMEAAVGVSDAPMTKRSNS